MILTLWTRRWGCGQSWLLARRTSVRPWLCFHHVTLALLLNLSEAQAPLQSTGASNTKTYLLARCGGASGDGRVGVLLSEI